MCLYVRNRLLYSALNLFFSDKNFNDPFSFVSLD